MSEAPAGLYLHIPFCSRICPYCDFAVRTGDTARRGRYVEHLLAEIELYQGYPLKFDTIYFGGGTPSALDPGELARIVDTLRDRLRFHEDTRIFLEANPEDVSTETATSWRRLGVATISLGVQSLDPEGLSFLGRAHGVDVARRAVEQAREVGFDTVSIDLIYGLPGQSLSGWSSELDRALELAPDHFSCYQLTIKQGTRFRLLERRGELTQLPEDDQAELFKLAHRRLAAAGFPGYEVSSFAASPHHRSRHNAKYWHHTPYLGLGPSAHSYSENRRWWNLRNTDPWQQAIDDGRRPVQESEVLNAETLALESLMLGLRTYSGVDLGRMRSRWGVNLVRDNEPLIRRLESDGLLSLEDDRLVPTLDGLAVADSLAGSFQI